MRTSPGKRTRLRIDPGRAAAFRKFHVATDPPPPPWEPEAKLEFDPELIQYETGSRKKGRVFGELEQDQIVVWLNLAWPIGPQIKNAKEVFKAERGRRQISSTRVRTDTYKNYLRVLDAVAAGTHLKKIAATIYPRRVNKHPEYNGTQAVRDDLKAAERLRDHDFWRITLAEQK